VLLTEQVTWHGTVAAGRAAGIVDVSARLRASCCKEEARVVWNEWSIILWMCVCVYHLAAGGLEPVRLV
jgi:hypothetical protein